MPVGIGSSVLCAGLRNLCYRSWCLMSLPPQTCDNVECTTVSRRDLIKRLLCLQVALVEGRGPPSGSHGPKGQDGGSAAVVALVGGEVGGLCVGAEAVAVAAATCSTGSAVSTGSRIERKLLGL
jgi:hypothetical protein